VETATRKSEEEEFLIAQELQHELQASLKDNDPKNNDPNLKRLFQKQLFQCMLSGALYVKSVIELNRSSNVSGLLVWQLSEIWPTGGWGSLEYGTPGVAGQVIGGRWKLLHHW
jgi:hypothetical protein